MNSLPDVTSRQRAAYSSNDAKWRAVLQKDPRADGRFFFSVKTTGIYCRPSCPARPARRENIAFHPTPEAAEAAGFRSCKRCLPNGPSLTEERVAAVANACRIIERTEPAPSLGALAKSVGMSSFHFHRIFKAHTGLTPKAYAAAHRARKVRETLRQSSTVTEAIYRAGFQSNGRFYARSEATLGMTARAFRSGGTGATIRFAVGECSLGAILVAASEKGVCAILLGDDPDALPRDLQIRFPRAALIPGDRDFETVVARVVGLVEAPRLGLALPLDIQGTVFQQRVWQVLREIPAGSTASYTEIANRLGLPKAARAVAAACGANPLAVAIPCHRVVRTGGALSGYRWGVERKRQLLAREKSAAA